LFFIQKRELLIIATEEESKSQIFTSTSEFTLSQMD